MAALHCTSLESIPYTEMQLNISNKTLVENDYVVSFVSLLP
jgi:hypothetical protein